MKLNGEMLTIGAVVLGVAYLGFRRSSGNALGHTSRMSTDVASKDAISPHSPLMSLIPYEIGDIYKDNPGQALGNPVIPSTQTLTTVGVS